MRVADRPTPPIALDDDLRLAQMVMRPVVAIAGPQTVAEWDDPDLVYDADGVGGSARVGTAMVGYARVGQE
jgi:hypothetical protein